MCIEKLLENQAFAVESCENCERHIVELREDGFSSNPFDDLDAIIVLEDRQHFAKAGRSSRFPASEVTGAFGFARNVAIVCFSRVARLGQGSQDTLHQRAIAKIAAQGGLTVVILTTRSRLGHWQAKALCHTHGRIRCFDNAGVSIVGRDYGAAA